MVHKTLTSSHKKLNAGSTTNLYLSLLHHIFDFGVFALKVCVGFDDVGVTTLVLVISSPKIITGIPLLIRFKNKIKTVSIYENSLLTRLI